MILDARPGIPGATPDLPQELPVINWGFLDSGLETYLPKRDRPELIEALRKAGFTSASEMWGNNLRPYEEQRFWVGINMLTFPQTEYLLGIMETHGLSYSQVTPSMLNEAADRSIDSLRPILGGGIFKPQSPHTTA